MFFQTHPPYVMYVVSEMSETVVRETDSRVRRGTTSRSHARPTRDPSSASARFQRAWRNVSTPAGRAGGGLRGGRVARVRAAFIPPFPEGSMGRAGKPAAGKPAGLFASPRDEITIHKPHSSGDGGGRLATLPKAVIADIVSLLDGPSVAKLGMTCRRMRDTTRPSGIWRALARAQEPHSPLVREDLARGFHGATCTPGARAAALRRRRGPHRRGDHHRVTGDRVAGAGAVRGARDPRPPLVPSL